MKHYVSPKKSLSETKTSKTHYLKVFYAYLWVWTLFFNLSGETMFQYELSTVNRYVESEVNIRESFEDVYLTRKEWSNILGISRTTIWRYERNIIRYCVGIKQEYRNGDRGERSNYLNNYQRWILTVIKGCLAVDGLGMKTSSDVIVFLTRNKAAFSIKSFENWRNENV